jgi:chromosome segregation protein
VHLRSLRIRGFKSFPDPLEVALEPGVAVVVGPNGSGKSNIADAVVWAAGSLTPSELRAEKPDDVLFSGGGDRRPAEHCEVELVFANEDGAWPDLDFSEVSIARRLVRGGEGQYLVNRAAVRRTDLVELLADVGLGSAMHSIVGQGTVEQVLASKPADRRELVEEAAGLGKFKRRKHRAELRLARVALQVERALDVEQEVRKRLRPLALQATAAERAEKLAGEIASLRARIAQIDLAAVSDRRREAEERRDAATLGRRGAQTRLEGLLGDRARAEDELSDAAGRREGAVATLYRLQAGAERLAVRAESASAVRDRLVSELAVLDPAVARRAAEGEPSPAALRARADAAREEARAAARERDDLVERARSADERLALLDRSLAEREGIAPAARALAESGERLALAAVTAAPGLERAVAAALGSRASAVLADDPPAALALLERARREGLGSLVVLAGRDPGELVEALPVVPLERLLDARVPSVTREGYGFDPGRGELWFSGETAEAVLLELEARRCALAEEARELTAQAAVVDGRAREAAAAAEAAELEYRSAVVETGSPVPALPRAARAVLEALTGAAERLEDDLARARSSTARLDAPLRARVDAGALRAQGLGEELRRLGAAEVELRRELEEASARLTAAEVELARIDGETDEAQRRLDVAGGVPPADGDHRDELVARADRLETRRAALGLVNPLAKEEYEAEKERLDDLRAQRVDLERSLEELERLRSELTDTVERRFAETFASVERHFREVSATLFAGGEGRLRLVEPEGDEEGAEPGIEVELRPAGKRVTRLSLLSGGEKALGAIAFLFSLFLARPCAFYLLDEVEAALDDSNIARFVELLRSYADRAQFVVVTHQKRTMEAADVLYGVTMGPDGVSQVVSRRLPRTEHAAA